MDEEHKFGKMEVSMRGIGLMERHKGEDDCSFIMEMCMKASSNRAKFMDWESTLEQTGQST